MSKDLEKALSFFEKIKEEVTKSGVNMLLPDEDQVEIEPGYFASGYFTDNDPNNIVYAVAMCKDKEDFLENSFPVAIHEYCHFLQWRDKNDFWSSFKLKDGKEPLDHVIEFFEGERELAPDKVKEYCSKQAMIEFDCEKMTLEMIEKHDLPVDYEDYAKCANAYVTFYYAMPKLKSWCHKKKPYRVPEIYEKMPSHMNLTESDYQDLADETEKLMLEYCI